MVDPCKRLRLTFHINAIFERSLRWFVAVLLVVLIGTTPGVCSSPPCDHLKNLTLLIGGLKMLALNINDR